MELKQSVRALCKSAPRELLDDFIASIGDDYFTAFSAGEISEHVRMIATLGQEHPVRVQVSNSEGNDFRIVIVGYDYLSQFSMICGLLSAFGFDIRTGDIYSYSKRTAASRIVDVFNVTLISGEDFDRARQREFEQELELLIRLLSEDAIQEARTRLYRFLAERIERMNEPLTGLLSLVKFTFDNNASPDSTVMVLESEDTFAFLYAVANALSMRGVDIRQVKIRGALGKTRDEFVISNSWGGKVKAGAEQERLKKSVAMIKQFTRFITDAPDPAKAMLHFDQFLDRIIEVGEDNIPEKALSFFGEPEGMRRLAQLLGSSDFLWEEFLRSRFTELISIIAEDKVAEPKTAMQRQLKAALNQASTVRKTTLNQFKDRQLFLIDVQHLIGANTTLFDFSGSLTDLAEVVLEEAARICFSSARSGKGSQQRFAIFGLGKFGGREMGYASDLELMFVHDGGDSEAYNALAHQIVGFIDARDKGIFHIDLRLRPYGDAGPWSSSFEQFSKYYSTGGEAAPFERQALIKLRWIAGDEKLGRRVEAHRDKFTYSGEPWDWADAMHLRQRQMRELVKPGKINVKYSAGGIIDIEYAVQYLQILNGREYPQIRLSTTLEALQRLRELQVVREPDYRLLHSSYVFLRKVINALRIVRGDSNDLVLPDESGDEFKSLARRLGYKGKTRTQSAALLATDILETMQQAHAYFRNRFAARP